MKILYEKNIDHPTSSISSGYTTFKVIEPYKVNLGYGLSY